MTLQPQTAEDLCNFSVSSAVSSIDTFGLMQQSQEAIVGWKGERQNDRTPFSKALISASMLCFA
ncbi:hypothetical protein Plhal703r1_c27g0110851 [Plasmopara halstedii]